ncbi:MAG: hypothetical protein IT379_12510 [Deltaproteobacteria bacterium]|nr:hypothetical protein [Deltaproteobacteria bacterium]
MSGMYVDSCGFVGCTAGLTITGSGTSITFSRGGGGPGGGGVTMGTLTLSGGVTAAGTFTTTCPSSGACDLESVMGTTAGLVFTDRSGASGTITLTGATASGSVTFPDCAGDRCGRFFYVTGAGATMTFADATGTMGTITLAGAPVCEG